MAKTFTYVQRESVGRDWNDHVNYETQRKLGVISEEQYKESVRALTGTVTAPGARPRRSLYKAIQDKEVLFQGQRFVKQPPNWDEIPFENVIRYVYNPETEKWDTKKERIQISEHPFDYGSQRMCFYLRNLDAPSQDCVFAAKKIAPLIEERESYFKDVAMQTHAQVFANKFNDHRAPKRVAFLDSWVIEFVDREHLDHYEPMGPQVMAVEPLLEGTYRKYNNNMDWTEVCARNTPQAFSHFTYECSEQKIIIVDVQGVNDIYTDPQFHTIEGINDPRFGTGNLGKLGMDAFFAKHRCNSICTFLKLPQRNKKAPDLFDGTMTNSRYMDRDSVATYDVQGSHMNSIPLPGGRETYDANQSHHQQIDYTNMPPVGIPGFKRNQTPSDSENTKCCCFM